MEGLTLVSKRPSPSEFPLSKSRLWSLVFLNICAQVYMWCARTAEGWLSSSWCTFLGTESNAVCRNGRKVQRRLRRVVSSRENDTRVTPTTRSRVLRYLWPGGGRGVNISRGPPAWEVKTFSRMQVNTPFLLFN